MKFYSAFDFLLERFQNVLDLTCNWRDETQDPKYHWPVEAWEKLVRQYCREYRAIFRLSPEGYSDLKVWLSLEKKFDKHFDELLFKTLE